jgi:hypothetical protein
MDVEKFVRHLCCLVLRHQMPVWNYFVNSFYSVGIRKLEFLIKKLKIKISAVFFSPVFGHQNPGSRSVSVSGFT